mmetsp:Transcript_37913/g.60894  ORF Transcript_37913/g.60894 Transcript_37913/m.60894 type:complete len:120 (-) Transcript_37913:244-603(-)
MDAKSFKKTKFFTSAKTRASFIDVIVRAIVAKGPTGKKLQIVQAEIIKALQKESALADSNLHRKSFGNLKQLFNEENFNGVFTLDKNVVILEKFEALKDSGALSEETLKAVKEAYDMIS